MPFDLFTTRDESTWEYKLILSSEGGGHPIANKVHDMKIRIKFMGPGRYVVYVNGSFYKIASTKEDARKMCKEFLKELAQSIMEMCDD